LPGRLNDVNSLLLITPDRDLSELHQFVLFAELVGLQEVCSRTQFDTDIFQEEIFQPEQGLILVCPSITSHVTIHGIEFETLTIDKQTILNETEQQICRFRPQIPVLNEGSLNARFLNERLQREILEAHERLRPSILSLFERFGECRQTDISWHERMKLIELEDQFYHLQMKTIRG
jgi:hypothetical protein